MKRLLVVVLISGCFGVDAPSIDHQRQAVGGHIEDPVLTGPANARLGAGLTTCDYATGNVVLASAPGIKRIYPLINGFPASDVSPYLFDTGGSIACASVDVPDAGPVANVFIAGTPSQVLVDGGFLLSGVGTSTRTAASNTVGAYLVGGNFFVRNILLQNLVVGDAGQPMSDIAFASSSSIVATAADQQTVLRFTSLAVSWTQGVPMPIYIHGQRIAVGNVHPHLGKEIIVGGVNDIGIPQVQIFGADGTLLDTKTGTINYGVALAIEKNVTIGVDALWVGEPATASVWRYFGDAGTQFEIGNDALSEAGAAIAVTASRDVWVGAPGFEGGKGAVFFIPAIDAGMPSGVCTSNSECGGCNARCVLGSGCTVECASGQVCNGATNMCVTPILVDSGVHFDAGTDAGAPDAGGEIDAGEIEVDAGEVEVEVDGGDDRAREFKSCGCSSAEALFAVLALVLISRRKVPCP